MTTTTRRTLGDHPRPDAISTPPTERTRVARRRIPPFETEITGLGDRGVGIGTAPDGRVVRVRGVPPGARVACQVFKRKKGELHARRTAMVRPPHPAAEPKCAVFGLCGGCILQEIPLASQRDAKHTLSLNGVGAAPDATIHPPRGTDDAFGYRNKVELSFGVRRYLSEAAHAAGEAIDGRFMGFHAPGRFDRVVDASRCELVSEAANAIIDTTRRVALAETMPPPYDVRAHNGFWRHLVLRQGFATGELLAVIYTSSEGTEAHVAELAEALLAAPLPNATLVGVVWGVNDGVADVARGEVKRVWGQAHLTEKLGDVAYQISPRAFFQTSTGGAEVLYDTIGEALGSGGTLVDLYCGAGSIGLYLADRFDRVVGIEEVPDAVENARANAEANGIDATFHCAKVEDALTTLAEIAGPRRIVVDPPRVGLHPKVAAAVAKADADVLVYVACHPGSLGRDRVILEEGGWRMTDLWTVDLFPQTGHVEAIARFVRDPA